MPNAKYVTAGKPNPAGAVFSAVLGTSLPTDCVSALDAAFADLGYVSEDGVTNSTNLETTKIKEWGGNTVLTIQTSKDDQFKFQLIEAGNEDVLKEVFGQSNVTSANGMITITANADEQNYRSYVIDMALSNGGIKRIVLPSAKVSSVGDITYKSSDKVGYDLTFDTAPDSTGNTHYEYIMNEIVTDEFEGDGSTVSFTLSETVGTVIKVTVNGTEITTGFTASGTTLTFSTAPANDAVIIITYAV